MGKDNMLAQWADIIEQNAERAAPTYNQQLVPRYQLPALRSFAYIGPEGVWLSHERGPDLAWNSYLIRKEECQSKT